MKPELTPFMLLLIFSMPLHTLSGVFLPAKLRQKLCESGHLGVSPEICNYPPLYGTCKQALTRFYYNTLTFLCEPFVFSGCSGNRNNFKHKYVCEYFCIPEKFAFHADYMDKILTEKPLCVSAGSSSFISPIPDSSNINYKGPP